MLSSGTDYQIDWPNFKPGSSIFLPAVDTKEVIESLKKESERLEFQFVHKIVIEDNVKGIRVWRL